MEEHHDASPSKSGPARPEQWLDEHGDYLFRFALARVRQEDVAEDLVQEALLSAFRNRASFAGRSTERTWLTGILKNKIFDHFRKSARETTFTDSDPDADAYTRGGHWIHENGPTEWRPGAEELLRSAEFLTALQSAIRRLPERLAAVFTLREIDGVPGHEICQILGITESNLWVMLHRARAALRRDLETSFFDPDEQGRTHTTL